MSLSLPPSSLLQQYGQLYLALVGGLIQSLSPLKRPASITSWYRDSISNRRAGGAARSQHLLGFAFDVVVDPSEAALFEMLARRAGFIVVREPDHHHLQAFEAGTIPPGLFDL